MKEQIAVMDDNEAIARAAHKVNEVIAIYNIASPDGTGICQSGILRGAERHRGARRDQPQQQTEPAGQRRPGSREGGAVGKVMR